MNILMLYNESFPSDRRVEKEAKVLIKADHNIFLIAQDKKEHVKEIKGIKVIYLTNNKFDSLIFRFNFSRPFLVNKIKKIIKKYNIRNKNRSNISSFS